MCPLFVDSVLTQLLNCTRRSLRIYVAYNFLAFAALLFTASCTPSASSAESPGTAQPIPTNGGLITVHYNERPPYLVTTEKGVGGLTGDPATIAFEKSKIPYKWVQTPTKRQMYLLEQNRGQDCLVGWFKNLEREKFAKFTLPVYQDRPQMALMRADNDKIPPGSSISEILTDPGLILLVKDGYSYGNFIDEKIKELNPVRTSTTAENSGMLKMIYARHADYFLIAPEEAEGLIRTSEFDTQDFKFVHFTDIPNGENRYILCSQQVEDAVIEQLNNAIRQYVNLPEP